ncbi:MAG TPA: hypothetical protein VNS19_12630 [Acidimicrobiales bacterium]|nr:hypothetical protein [Acidimicrobiales bacterium]
MDEADDGGTNRMQELVDVGDIDGLLDLVSLDDIARAWNRYTDAPRPKNDDHPDWWAIDLFWDPGVTGNTALRRELIVKLLEHAAPETIGAVAAGPLEDFLSDDEDDLRWIEAEAARNPRMRQALTGVWIATDVTDATLTRLDAAAGEELPRPRPPSEWPPELIAYRDAEHHLADVAGNRADFANIADPSEEQKAAAAAYDAALKALTERGAP